LTFRLKICRQMARFEAKSIQSTHPVFLMKLLSSKAYLAPSSNMLWLGAERKWHGKFQGLGWNYVCGWFPGLCASTSSACIMSWAHLWITR
jgi:hypothetical protein